MVPQIPALLSVDHLDLLVTAATRWRVITPRIYASLASQAEGRLLVITAEDAGRIIQTENLAAVRWLTLQGRTRLVERIPEPVSYVHRPIEHLRPVEVIKAVHAAQAACTSSPSWFKSRAQQLLAAILTAATHRLDGYDDAPWAWTRPDRRAGAPIGIAGQWRPEVPGLAWVEGEDLRERWDEASLVVITPEAAATVPADLPDRSGVIVLVSDDTPPKAVWDALVALDMQAPVSFWPTCRPWLLQQLSHPEADFVEHRSPQNG
jgi:hypothetical protein